MSNDHTLITHYADGQQETERVPAQKAQQYAAWDSEAADVSAVWAEDDRGFRLGKWVGGKQVKGR